MGHPVYENYRENGRYIHTQHTHTYARNHARTHARTHTRTHICMYVCMYLFIYLCEKFISKRLDNFLCLFQKDLVNFFVI